MAYLKINNTDISHLVSGLKISFETLANGNNNAAGDTVIDIINKKADLRVTLRHMTDDEMNSFLNTIENYQVDVSFRDPRTGELTTISAYPSAPQPEYYTIQPNHVIYKPMSINFIEL
jgi:hypothetical protein